MASLIKRFGITSLIIIALAVAKPTFVFANEKFTKRFKLIVEGRYLFMNREPQTYAELADMNGSTGTLEIEPDYTWSGKAGLGIQFTETFDIFASYSGLKSKGEDSFQYYPGGQVPINLLSKYSSYWNAAAAEVETSYQVIDFEAGHTFKLGGSDIRLSAGVRYADFNQEVNTAFQFFYPPYVILLNERRNVDTWGVGPRLGLNFKLPIFNSGLHLVGAAGGAVLFGKMESVTDEWVESQNYYNQALYSDSRTIYSTEGELGLAFIGKMTSGGDISVVLGYRCEHWKDINYTQTNPSFLGNSFGANRADQFFHGPFVQIGISF